jgi:hypothetical protein
LLRISIRSDGYAFQEETLTYCEELGLVVKEIPIVFRDSQGPFEINLGRCGRIFHHDVELAQETNQPTIDTAEKIENGKVRVGL